MSKSKDKLTDEQVGNWRKVLALTLGEYAFTMPKEEVQKMRDEMQKNIDEN